MANKTIYIARHGERLDFVDPTWYKKAKCPHDPPLTALGNEQATDLGRKLAELNIGHVFASPFQRCVNTASNAAVACSPELRVCIEPGACEWLCKEWYIDSEKGPVWRELDSLAKEFSNVDASYQPVFPMSHNFDGYPESRDDLKRRCEKMVRAILETAQGDGNILIIGHGSSVEALKKMLVPGIADKMITYCCLTECIPTAEPFKYTLGMHCDTSFLTDPEDSDKTRYI